MFYFAGYTHMKSFCGFLKSASSRDLLAGSHKLCRYCSQAAE